MVFTLCRRFAEQFLRTGNQLRTGRMAFSLTSLTMAEDEVIIETKNNCGTITLNRPKALNALNLNMMRMIRPVLKRWDQDPDINVIVIKGSGEKAFCSGNLLKLLHEITLTSISKFLPLLPNNMRGKFCKKWLIFRVSKDLAGGRKRNSNSGHLGDVISP